LFGAWHAGYKKRAVPQIMKVKKHAMFFMINLHAVDFRE
jgi:hypothetical protein